MPEVGTGRRQSADSCMTWIVHFEPIANPFFKSHEIVLEQQYLTEPAEALIEAIENWLNNRNERK